MKSSDGLLFSNCTVNHQLILLGTHGTSYHPPSFLINILMALSLFCGLAAWFLSDMVGDSKAREFLTKWLIFVELGTGQVGYFVTLNNSLFIYSFTYTRSISGDIN